jgi:hypothetical protein
MVSNRDIDMVFFDIGGTLGAQSNDGQVPVRSEQCRAAEGEARVVGLRIGISTTLGPD